MRPKHVLVDTDPGIDDAFALYWLCQMHKRNEIRLVGVTTTSGNLGAASVYENARVMVSAAGLADVPVYQQRSSHAPATDAIAIHGPDGLGALRSEWQKRTANGVQVPPCDNSAEAMVRIIRQSEEPITILALGPLTNLMDADRRSPGVLKRAAELIIMGGAVDVPGNITATAEYNVHCDPVAWSYATDSGNCPPRTTLVPLDVTRTFVCTMSDLRVHGPDDELLLSMFRYLETTNVQQGETMAGALMHDACAAVYTLHPHYFECEPIRLRVCTATGATVRSDEGQATVRVVTKARSPPAAMECFCSGLAHVQPSGRKTGE